MEQPIQGRPSLVVPSNIKIKALLLNSGALSYFCREGVPSKLFRGKREGGGGAYLLFINIFLYKTHTKIKVISSGKTLLSKTMKTVKLTRTLTIDIREKNSRQ